MRFNNKESGLSIIIDEKLLTKLYSTSLDHYPCEYGGLLIGYYSQDRKELNIISTLLPKDYSSTKFNFSRGIKGLKSKLEKLYKKTPSQYYVGEWHSHPDNSPVPSGTDLKAFQEIVAHEKVLIENPILLLLGVDTSSCNYMFYVYYDQVFLRYEKEG